MEWLLKIQWEFASKPGRRKTLEVRHYVHKGPEVTRSIGHIQGDIESEQGGGEP